MQGCVKVNLGSWWRRGGILSLTMLSFFWTAQLQARPAMALYHNDTVEEDSLERFIRISTGMLIDPGDPEISPEYSRLPVGAKVEMGLGLLKDMREVAVSLMDEKESNAALDFIERGDRILDNLVNAADCMKTCSIECFRISDAQKKSLMLSTLIYLDLGNEDEVLRQLTATNSLCTDDEARDVESLLMIVVDHYTQKKDFEGAYAAIFASFDGALFAGKPQIAENTAKLCEGVSRQLFRSISWDLETEKRLSDDPRDFVDGIDPGRGMTTKYGMTNMREDEATVGGMWVTENEELPGYVRDLLAEGKFELPAKYMITAFTSVVGLNNTTGGLKCPNRELGHVSVKEIVRALDGARGVPDWTASVIRLTARVNDLIEERCGARRGRS